MCDYDFSVYGCPLEVEALQCVQSSPRDTYQRIVVLKFTTLLEQAIWPAL
jgi:hypothetical protein